MIGPASLPPIQVLGAVVALAVPRRLHLVLPEEPHGRRDARRRRQPAGGAWRWASTSSAISRSPGRWRGIVSALGGIVWGSMLGVDVQLALVGLKVFPVVILGGLDSIAGAMVGGLIVGIVENLAAGYLDPYVGGGTKDFAPYVLMILVLMVRPVRHLRQDARSSGSEWVAGRHVPSRSPASSRPPTPPTWRSIRCRSPGGRWRRWRCSSS